MTRSTAQDFDFFHGSWAVSHRRLVGRLIGSQDWQEFGGTCITLPILGGMGNIDDNLLHLPAGDYRAATLRTFDAQIGKWSIWWVDGRNPHRLDPPVVGGFEDGTGIFFAKDVFEGQPILVQFMWRPGTSDQPIWEQAFSGDDGVSWEVNWVMSFQRMAGAERV